MERSSVTENPALLKAEMEVKIEKYNLSGISSGSREYRTIIPASSIDNDILMVDKKIFKASLFLTSIPSSTFAFARRVWRFEFLDSPLRTNLPMKIAKTKVPNPPT
jgi:hypothetical protein